MADGARGGEFEFRFGAAGKGQGSARRGGGDVMRILVMGDFSGRFSRGVVEPGGRLAGREVLEIDIDTFDAAMARLGAAVLDPLAKPEDSLPIEFRSLDDFHPDRLVRRVEEFVRLRSIRERLLDPARFESGAKELVQLLGFDPSGGSSNTGTGEESKATVSGAGDFAALLGGSVTPPRDAPAKSGFDVEAFVKGLVGSHATRTPDGRQGAMLAAADAAISGLMRAFMHSDGVKELERVWRGLHRLITTLETGDTLRVHLLDVSKAELIADLAEASRAGGVEKSGLYAQLVESTVLSPGGESWGLVVGCFLFGRSVQDAVLLSGISQVTALAGAPFLAGGAPSLVGCASFADGPDPSEWSAAQDAAAQAWDMVRSTDESKSVALGMPRALLRVPYGPGGEEAETFKFEELPPPAPGENAPEDRERHEAYLWGHPGLILAEVLGKAFLADGWSMDSGAADDVMGLPVHSFSEGPGGTGPKRVMPCAEAWLTERGAHVLRQAGITPIMSIKGRDGARVPGVMSLHQSGSALSGRWE